MIFGCASVDPNGSKTGHVYCRETHRTPEPPRSYECPIGAPLHTCKTRNSKIQRVRHSNPGNSIQLDPRLLREQEEKGWNDFFEGRRPRYGEFRLTTDTAFASYDRQTAGDGLRSARNEVEFPPSIYIISLPRPLLGRLGIPTHHFENRRNK